MQTFNRPEKLVHLSRLVVNVLNYLSLSAGSCCDNPPLHYVNQPSVYCIRTYIHTHVTMRAQAGDLFDAISVGTASSLSPSEYSVVPAACIKYSAVT